MLRSFFQLLCQVKGTPFTWKVQWWGHVCGLTTLLGGTSWAGVSCTLIYALAGAPFCIYKSHHQLLSYKPYSAFLIVFLLYLPLANCHGRTIETNLRERVALIFNCFCSKSHVSYSIAQLIQVILRSLPIPKLLGVLHWWPFKQTGWQNFFIKRFSGYIADGCFFAPFVDSNSHT